MVSRLFRDLQTRSMHMPENAPTLNELKMIADLTERRIDMDSKTPADHFYHLYYAQHNNVQEMRQAFNTRSKDPFVYRRMLDEFVVIEHVIVMNWNLSRLGGVVPRRPDADIDNDPTNFPLRSAADDICSHEGKSWIPYMYEMREREFDNDSGPAAFPSSALNGQIIEQRQVVTRPESAMTQEDGPVQPKFSEVPPPITKYLADKRARGDLPMFPSVEKQTATTNKAPVLKSRRAKVNSTAQQKALVIRPAVHKFMADAQLKPSSIPTFIRGLIAMKKAKTPDIPSNGSKLQIGIHASMPGNTPATVQTLTPYQPLLSDPFKASTSYESSFDTPFKAYTTSESSFDVPSKAYTSYESSFDAPFKAPTAYQPFFNASALFQAPQQPQNPFDSPYTINAPGMSKATQQSQDSSSAPFMTKAPTSYQPSFDASALWKAPQQPQDPSNAPATVKALQPASIKVSTHVQALSTPLVPAKRKTTTEGTTTVRKTSLVKKSTPLRRKSPRKVTPRKSSPPKFKGWDISSDEEDAFKGSKRANALGRKNARTGSVRRSGRARTTVFTSLDDDTLIGNEEHDANEEVSPSEEMPEKGQDKSTAIEISSGSSDSSDSSDDSDDAADQDPKDFAHVPIEVSKRKSINNDEIMPDVSDVSDDLAHGESEELRQSGTHVAELTKTKSMDDDVFELSDGSDELADEESQELRQSSTHIFIGEIQNKSVDSDEIMSDSSELSDVPEDLSDQVSEELCQGHIRNRRDVHNVTKKAPWSDVVMPQAEDEDADNEDSGDEASVDDQSDKEESGSEDNDEEGSVDESDNEGSGPEFSDDQGSDNDSSSDYEPVTKKRRLG